MRHWPWCLLAIVACALAACPTVTLRADETLVWRGCGVSKIAFMEACAHAYNNQTGVNFRLSGGGATLGIEAAASGGADLGGTCRACLKSRGEDKLPIKLTVVAWDALAVVVHPSNNVANITRDQLRDVLQQRITNWKQLGGKDARIIVVVRRSKASGVGYSTRRLILNDPDADYGRTSVRLNSSGPVEELVERQPNAIAVTGVSSAGKRKLEVLSIDGHKPTVDNIATGKYPYYRPLYIAHRPGENPHADRFVKWLVSDQGQAVIGDERTVTLAQGAKLARDYQAFDTPSQIANYQTLMELARQGGDSQ